MRRTSGVLWAVAAVAAAALAVVLFVLPTGQYLILPGITQNLNRIVHVSGGQPPRRGRILMVAVSVEPANWLQVLTARWRPGQELLPAQELMPSGMTFNQYVELSYLQMQQSHDDAKAAAFRALGMPVRTLPPEVYVGGIEPGGPSNGRLEVMDRLVAVDGAPVTSAAEVVSMMHGIRPGSVVRVRVERNGAARTVAIRTATSPIDHKSAFLGVELMQVTPYRFPREVRIDTSQIGGPSAGMMFSLAIIAQVRPRPTFPGSEVVAGTGEITPSGQVEPIGGVAEKVITAYRSGAHLFLCPAANYQAAVAVKKALGIPIRIVPVATLGQALTAVGYTPGTSGQLAG
jgi:PDZ domain-containing protein